MLLCPLLEKIQQQLEVEQQRLRESKLLQEVSDLLSRRLVVGRLRGVVGLQLSNQAPETVPRTYSLGGVLEGSQPALKQPPSAS